MRAAVDAGQGWTFGPFTLSADGVLRRNDVEVPLAPKGRALLLHLLENRPRYVPRSELLAVVWSGVRVSEAAFDSVVRDLRRALGDTSRVRRYVATRRSQGLCFVHPVRELRCGEASREEDWKLLAEHFERALHALDRVVASRGGTPEVRPEGTSLRERGPFLVALARSRWAAGATREARDAFLDAARVARRTADGEVLAQAALGFAGRSDVSPGVNREAVGLLEEALRALPEDASATRSEVLARLGTELHHEHDGARAGHLTEQAVAAAERSGDPATLAYALVSRHFVLRRADVAPAARRPLSERAARLVADAPPSDVLAFALQETLLDDLEEGEGAAAEATLAHYARVVEALRQPFFLWIRSFLEGSRLVLAGRVDEAERGVPAVLEAGRQLGSPNADAAFAAQLFMVRDAQGRLAELAPLVDGLAGGADPLPIARAAQVAILDAAGTAGEARAALDALARDLARLPRNENWLGMLGLLARAAARAGGAVTCDLADRLRPYAGRMIVVGHGAMVWGAVDHHLGVLEAALGAPERAAAHLEAARALHRRARAPLWAGRTEEALADLRAGRPSEA